MQKEKLFAGIITLASALGLSGCTASSEPIAAVTDFQPEKYMGVWYEIARLPHYFERNMDYVEAKYTLKPDGSIRVENRGMRGNEKRKIVGKAKLKFPKQQPLTGELRVSFFGPFYSDYRIIELPPDYGYAVVTGSGRDYLWILSRKPVMDRKQLDAILQRLREWNFAVGKLEFPKQRDPGNQ